MSPPSRQGYLLGIRHLSYCHATVLPGILKSNLSKRQQVGERLDEDAPELLTNLLYLLIFVVLEIEPKDTRQAFHHQAAFQSPKLLETALFKYSYIP